MEWVASAAAGCLAADAKLLCEHSNNSYSEVKGDNYLNKNNGVKRYSKVFFIKIKS